MTPGHWDARSVGRIERRGFAFAQGLAFELGQAKRAEIHTHFDLGCTGLELFSQKVGGVLVELGAKRVAVVLEGERVVDALNRDQQRGPDASLMDHRPSLPALDTHLLAHDQRGIAAVGGGELFFEDRAKLGQRADDPLVVPARVSGFDTQDQSVKVLGHDQERAMLGGNVKVRRCVVAVLAMAAWLGAACSSPNTPAGANQCNNRSQLRCLTDVVCEVDAGRKCEVCRCGTPGYVRPEQNDTRFPPQ